MNSRRKRAFAASIVLFGPSQEPAREKISATMPTGSGRSDEAVKVKLYGD